MDEPLDSIQCPVDNPMMEENVSTSDFCFRFLEEIDGIKKRNPKTTVTFKLLNLACVNTEQTWGDHSGLGLET